MRMTRIVLLTLVWLGLSAAVSADELIAGLLRSPQPITAEVLQQHGDEATHKVRILNNGKAQWVSVSAIVVTISLTVDGVHHTAKILANYEEGIEGSDVGVVCVTHDGQTYQLLTEELARDNDLCHRVVPRLPLVPNCSCITRPFRVKNRGKP